MKKLIVVNDPKEWKIEAASIEVVSAFKYINDPKILQHKQLRVFNLCDHYRYQSRGYYVSLLALARGHVALPSARTVLDIQSSATVRVISDELNELFQRKLKRLKSDKFILSIYFGRNISKQYDEIAMELSKLFPAPLLRAKFVRNNGQWRIHRLGPIAVADIEESHMPYVNQFANEYFHVRRYRKRKSKDPVYALAVLANDKDITAPSNQKALQKFFTLGRKVGLELEMIGPKDINRLAAFDALFIRENTRVNHHTYRFACLAESEGIPVIDSPEAIIRCNNKVFLAELLSVNGIATPKTRIISKKTLDENLDQIKFPLVLKLPDSSSSLGVEKVSSHAELKERSEELFKHTELLIAQEYTPTDFDWRIGILDHVPLFACKYFMAKGHWQIYNWASEERNEKEGDHLTIDIAKAPSQVVKTALRSVRLIGDGLFGVDLKVVNGKPVVIEVNENPNIDAGVEDQILGDELYLKILSAFRRRIDEKFEYTNLKFPIPA